MALQGFELKKYYTARELQKFANYMLAISSEIGFKVSSRGWCYILEGHRLINKNQFDKCEELINNCRRKGYLPIDFVAEEKAREFNGLETPTSGTVVDLFGTYIEAAPRAANYYTPDWWEGEDYYIQVIVEKIDLVTLFEPVCANYHIPIANTKGWSSMLQRAEYARRFSEARDKGMDCVLLYCGDHDPDGLRISDFIQKNLEDLKDITWDDGTAGYDPEDLIIERFGLNYDFITANRLTWIDNLITGGNKNLASPHHRNFKLPYLQNYLKKYGARKVEANAIVTQPRAAQDLMRKAIEKYLGPDAPDRFRTKREAVREELNTWMAENKVTSKLASIRKAIDKYNKDNE